MYIKELGPTRTQRRHTSFPKRRSVSITRETFGERERERERERFFSIKRKEFETKGVRNFKYLTQYDIYFFSYVIL